MKVLAISGSLRSASSNAALLRAAAALAPPGMEFVPYQGLGALPHFNPDLDAEGAEPPAAVAALRALVAQCDGLVICSPEYAHGVPGSLKNALDWLVSFPQFAGKPVLLLNASAAGGQHAQEGLAETLRTMSARVLPESLVSPFLARKLEPGAELPEPARSLLRGALAALASAR